MSWADATRVFAVVLTACFMFGFPRAITAHVLREAWRVWLLIAAVELYAFSTAVTVVARFGGPLVWYRAPFGLASGIAGVAYLLVRRRDVRRGQRLARRVNDDEDGT